VTFTGTRPDGSPRARQNGRPVRAPFFGQSSFATHSLVTERNIVPVPADAPLRYLAGFTCGVQTGAGAILNAMPVRPGSRVAIWGAGAVGLAAVMAAAAAGDRLGHPRRRQRGPRHDRQPGRDRGRGRVARHPRHRHRRLPGGRYDQAGAHLQLKGPAGNTADPELVDTSGKVLSPLLTPEVRVAKPVLRVIIGSTRPGRIGPSVAEWIIERAREHGGFDVEVTDLAELNLPIYDEPNHPRLKKYVHQHTKDWSALVEGSDAFIFVVPEYNYGFNAATKNAIDYVFNEWAHKAAGIVSYGGVAAGTRATQMLKQVFSALKVVPVPEAVNIPFVFKHLDEDKRFKSTEEMEQAATAMLDELQRWTEALLTLRAK
jgi:NAD(P)H-dependent FMN reductase